MSATSRHSPAIPLSPSSPPDTGVKERSKTHLIEIEPQSPASPPLMSVATKSYASPFTDTQASSDAATSQQSFSPPTSANMSTQDLQHSVITDPTAFTTPPSSIGGVSQIQTSEDRDQHRSKRQKIDSEEARNEDNMDTEESPYPHAMEAGGPPARYAIVTRSGDAWQVEHRAVVYDWETAAQLAECNGRPDWAAWLRTGRA